MIIPYVIDGENNMANNIDKSDKKNINSIYNKKMIIFDLGGVVLQFDHMITSKKLADFSKYSSDEIYKKIFNSDLNKDYDCGKISSRDFYKRVMEILDIDIPFSLFKEFWCKIFWIDDSMEKFIRELKKNDYKLYLLSNTNELHFEHEINDFSIMKEFDEFFLSYKMGHRKPNKEIFLEVLERTGFDANNFIFIDDKKEFVDVARGLGFMGILFENLDLLKKEFEIIGINIV